uniref:ATP synthase F0 subunit 8 n=1 Tax=Goeldia sp. DPP-2018 TaxID=2136113 RepID=A0A2U8XE50_9ARAC|nr:ATP synthase F0 subunit 8 [Goeldia sp. DPP-2018]
MPQLMPMWWVMSSLMFVLFLVVWIYVNFFLEGGKVMDYFELLEEKNKWWW